MGAARWAPAVAVLLASGLPPGCSSMPHPARTGRLSLSVTDTPVDRAAALFLTIAAVALEGVSGSRDQGPWAVPPGRRLLNLMAYTGTDSAPILSGVAVPAGTYRVRLDLDLRFSADAQGSWIAFAEDSPECQDPAPARVVLGQGRQGCRFPLAMPGGAPPAVRPEGVLTVEAGGTPHFTVELDLRRSVLDPLSTQEIAYVLRPTGARLVDDAAAGSVAGTIDASVFPSGCTPTDAKVYLYDRSGAAGAFFPDDMHPANEAFVASTGVHLVATPRPGYRYLIGFVPAGAYAVAVTCGTEDDPEEDDEHEFLASVEGLVVSAGVSTVRDVPPVFDDRVSLFAEPEAGSTGARAGFRRP